MSIPTEVLEDSLALGKQMTGIVQLASSYVAAEGEIVKKVLDEDGNETPFVVCIGPNWPKEILDADSVRFPIRAMIEKNKLEN